MNRIKVLVFPKDANPYQNLLYGIMVNQAEITYLQGLTSSQTINNLLFPFQLILYRLMGYKIFHLHWVYKFTFPGTSNTSRLVSTIYYYLILTFIKICGYRIVWTVHNVMPHSKILSNDIKARRFLSHISSAKIIHSVATLAELKKYKININNCHLVPIGNYIGLYPNTITKEKARQTLNINLKKFVFLFLGRIETYKGIENLLSVFSKLNSPDTKLIIAGRCTDLKFTKKIQKYKKMPSLLIHDRYISDDEIQTYFNAADIAVYPFEKVTTSSSVILALSFKKPVIFPKTGNLVDLPSNIGYSYDQTNSNGLRDSLEAAINSKLETGKLSMNAYTYAKKLDWKNIAKATIKIYSSL